MKPFINNPWTGFAVAGGLSILFGCVVFLIVLLLVFPLSGCSGAYPMMASTDDELPGNVPLSTAAGPAPTMSAGARPTAPAVKTPQTTQAPALPEKRLVSMEYPRSLRTGDGDIIKMMIEMDERGRITPTAEVSGHQLKSSPVEIPNLYETHQIIAEARLDLAGIEVHPQENFTEMMLPGKPVVFYWSIKAPDSGTFRGTVWLHLNLSPKDGGKPTRLTLLALRVDIEATSLLGLGGDGARWVGTGGSLLSFVFGIPFMETVISRAWKRLRRMRIQPSQSSAGGAASANKMTRGAPPQGKPPPGAPPAGRSPPGDF